MAREPYGLQDNIMNWYKKSQKKVAIEQIARQVYDEFAAHYDDVLQALCLPVSRQLRDKLIQAGYNAQVVQGTFYIDEDLNEVDEDVLHNPLHYWVEVNGQIVDITAKQFQDEVDGEELDPITIGAYTEYPRYNPIHRGWK